MVEIENVLLQSLDREVEKSQSHCTRRLRRILLGYRENRWKNLIKPIHQTARASGFSRVHPDFHEPMRQSCPGEGMASLGRSDEQIYEVSWFCFIYTFCAVVHSAALKPRCMANDRSDQRGEYQGRLHLGDHGEAIKQKRTAAAIL